MNSLHTIVNLKAPNICEIVAMRNEKVIYEDYWHGYHKEHALNIMSVTKSVMAILLGIAIDKGYVKSTNQKVLDFFPGYVTKRGEKTIFDVTIAHLITMTAPYKYTSEPWTKICTSEDWTKGALDILGGKSGITGEFKYSTLGIQILAGIITNSSKMTTLEFTNEYLFKPLGIPSHVNANVHNKEEQFEFLMSKKPKGNVWFSDPKGCNTAGWGLALSAYDMAKIGQMCLNKGVYNNKRIISSDWIEEIQKPRIKCGQRFGYMSYGYLWWIYNEERGIYCAIGDGGNVIYINPQNNLVVAVTATFKPMIFDRVDFIQQYIEPLFL